MYALSQNFLCSIAYRVGFKLKKPKKVGITHARNYREAAFNLMVFCRRGPRRSILKSPNERRSRELRTMRRRVKRSSIVINNSDPTGESRSGYRERFVKQIRYIILLNERERRERISKGHYSRK